MRSVASGRGGCREIRRGRESEAGPVERTRRERERAKEREQARDGARERGSKG